MFRFSRPCLVPYFSCTRVAPRKRVLIFFFPLMSFGRLKSTVCGVLRTVSSACKRRCVARAGPDGGFIRFFGSFRNTRSVSFAFPFSKTTSTQTQCLDVIESIGTVNRPSMTDIISRQYHHTAGTWCACFCLFFLFLCSSQFSFILLLINTRFSASRA